MNVKICDKCGKAVWKSDKYCECGRAYEDIVPKREKIEGAFERRFEYESVSNKEIDEWFRKWEEKYNIP